MIAQYKVISMKLQNYGKSVGTLTFSQHVHLNSLLHATCSLSRTCTLVRDWLCDFCHHHQRCSEMITINGINPNNCPALNGMFDHLYNGSNYTILMVMVQTPFEVVMFFFAG